METGTEPARLPRGRAGVDARRVGATGAAIMLALFAMLFSLVPLRTAVQIGADEGFELAKATLWPTRAPLRGSLTPGPARPADNGTGRTPVGFVPGGEGLTRAEILDVRPPGERPREYSRRARPTAL